MTIRLELLGCAPTPLASYLKAIGILRLVSEQKDSNARGHWEGEHFVLSSTLDREAALAFFREDYRPTPIVAPWGGRSGFYDESSEKSAREALNNIVAAAQGGNERVQPFANVVERVRDVLKNSGFVDKPKEDDKLRLLRICRAELPDELLSWLDACYVLTADYRRFPPLLGTGGNEGSGSYVSGFAQLVVSCLIERACDAALPASVFGGNAPQTTSGQTPGQFSAAAAGGPNMGVGFSGPSTMNPWDFLLLLEGTLGFASSATRRHDSMTHGAHAFPFTVEVTGSGHGSVATFDEAKARAELWLPVWSRQATWREVSSLVSEGRITLGRRAAASGLDVTRAIASLGVDRGIASFQRHAIFERLGQNNLAIPLQRVHVRAQPDADLLADLDAGNFLDRLRNFARADTAPGRIKQRTRQLEDAIFTLASRPDRLVLQRILVLLGELQRLVGGSSKARDAGVHPVPLLQEDWALRADDGTDEFRIAAAIAGLHADGARDPSGKTDRWPLRQHLAPIASDGYSWDPNSRDVAWGGGSLIENLVHMLDHRLLGAERRGLDDKPLFGTPRADLESIATFLRGGLDERRIAEFVLGLSLVRLPRALPQRERPDDAILQLPAAYRVLRPFFVPNHLLIQAKVIEAGTKLSLPRDLVTRLCAGHVADTMKTAWQRLQHAGVQIPRFPIKPPAAPNVDGRRLVATLMIPTSVLLPMPRASTQSSAPAEATTETAV